MGRKRQSREAAVAIGLVSGVVGGMMASFVMSQFQSGLSKLASSDSTQAAQESGDDATVKTASAVSESMFGHALTKGEKEAAGPAVHYAFGATMGAVYGVLSAIAPAVSSGWGLPFGTALWLAADEVAVPALGLSKAPTEYPASTHASALASHLVYGLSVDLVRRGFRAAL
jgi:putative membrane protein